MFTFKTEKPTGKWKSFQDPQHYIKLKKIEVGMIEPRYPYRISFMVIKDDINEDNNHNCTWKWVYLKAKFESLESAKEYLKTHFEIITQKCNLVKTNL